MINLKIGFWAMLGWVGVCWYLLPLLYIGGMAEQNSEALASPFWVETFAFPVAWVVFCALPILLGVCDDNLHLMARQKGVPVNIPASGGRWKTFWITVVVYIILLMICFPFSDGSSDPLGFRAMAQIIYAGLILGSSPVVGFIASRIRKVNDLYGAYLKSMNGVGNAISTTERRYSDFLYWFIPAVGFALILWICSISRWILVLLRDAYEMEIFPRPARSDALQSFNSGQGLEVCLLLVCLFGLIFYFTHRSVTKWNARFTSSDRIIWHMERLTFWFYSVVVYFVARRIVDLFCFAGSKLELITVVRRLLEKWWGSSLASTPEFLLYCQMLAQTGVTLVFLLFAWMSVAIYQHRRYPLPSNASFQQPQGET